MMRPCESRTSVGSFSAITILVGVRNPAGRSDRRCRSPELKQGKRSQTFGQAITQGVRHGIAIRQFAAIGLADRPRRCAKIMIGDDAKLRACDLVKLRLDDICSGAKERPDLPSAQRGIDCKCNRPPTATLVTHAMSKLTKRDFAMALFGSLAVAVVFLAVAFYVVHFYDDGARCDRACIAESGEEP